MAIEPLVEPMPVDLRTGPLIQVRQDGRLVLFLVEDRVAIASHVMDGFQAGMLATILMHGARNATELRGLPPIGVPNPRGFPEVAPNEAHLAQNKQTGSHVLLLTFGQAQIGFRFDTESLRQLTQTMAALGADASRAH